MNDKYTDRELLELAAKAAGIDHPGGDHSLYNDGRLWDCKGLRWWNPLVDDGDAMRLAAEMRMEIRIMGSAVYVGRGPFETYVPVTDDHAKAARLGVVKIAASGVVFAMAEKMLRAETDNG